MPPAPPVLLLTKEQMSVVSFRRAWKPSDNVLAAYDRDSATVYLRNDWDLDELRSRAALLHELVHHVQLFNRIPYECPAAREPLAYGLTLKWLREQGAKDPYALLDTDEFTIMVRSMCPED